MQKKKKKTIFCQKRMEKKILQENGTQKQA
jgi:hypothetical protein